MFHYSLNKSPLALSVADKSYVWYVAYKDPQILVHIESI